MLQGKELRVKDLRMLLLEYCERACSTLVMQRWPHLMDNMIERTCRAKAGRRGKRYCSIKKFTDQLEHLADRMMYIYIYILLH